MKCPKCQQEADLTLRDDGDEDNVVTLTCSHCGMCGDILTTHVSSSGNQFTREALREIVLDDYRRREDPS